MGFSFFHILCAVICFVGAERAQREHVRDAAYLSALLYIVTVFIDHAIFPEENTFYATYYAVFAALDVFWMMIMYHYHRFLAAVIMIPFVGMELVALASKGLAYQYYHEAMIVLNLAFLFALFSKDEYAHL